MSRSSSLTLLCVCIVLLCAAAVHTHACAHTHGGRCFSAPNYAPVTLSPSGQFVGSWMQTRRGRSFQAYRGIPYAEPPVGDLRFQPPVPILRYQSPVNASQEGPACPLPAPSPDYLIDEDCLRINVYTPRANGTGLLPVIFYLHAGGFYALSGRSDVVGPHYLLDRGIVLVTSNYRLATLGFLATGDAFAPGNNGLKDQVAALKWVQRNIASFGGDPNLVTLAGSSAGAVSVALHMVSPMSQGLFHRAMSLSGSPVAKAPLPTHQRETAMFQAEVLKCPMVSTRAMYECLREKPWRELGNSLNEFIAEYSSLKPVQFWAPVVEPDFGQERFLTMDPMEAIKQGMMHQVPYVITQTRGEVFHFAYGILRNETLLNKMNTEWSTVAPIAFLLPEVNASAAAERVRQEYFKGGVGNDERTAAALGQLYADSHIGFSVHRLANAMSEHSARPVYYSQFAYMGNYSHYTDPATGRSVGEIIVNGVHTSSMCLQTLATDRDVAHHDDAIYLFTMSYRFPTIEVSDSEDSKMVDRMTGLWYNFARYGDPAPRDVPSPLRGLPWPPMAPARRTYLRINQQPSLHQNLFEDRYNIWEELYKV